MTDIYIFLWLLWAAAVLVKGLSELGLAIRDRDLKPIVQL